jgi:hypothetical protein
MLEPGNVAIEAIAMVRKAGSDMVRELTHFIGGLPVAGTSGRFGDVYDPSTRAWTAPEHGRGPGARAARLRRRGARRHRERRSGAGRMGVVEPAAPRASARSIPRAGGAGPRIARQAAVIRTREDRRRLEGRHPARHRGHRVRPRRAAPAQGRILDGRRDRHRRVLDASAARCRRGHHPVQLPGHDPPVESGTGPRRRQRLHPQALRAGPLRAARLRRTLHRGRDAAGRLQRRERRQGGRRRIAGG